MEYSIPKKSFDWLIRKMKLQTGEVLSQEEWREEYNALKRQIFILENNLNKIRKKWWFKLFSWSLEEK